MKFSKSLPSLVNIKVGAKKLIKFKLQLHHKKLSIRRMKMLNKLPCYLHFTKNSISNTTVLETSTFLHIKSYYANAGAIKEALLPQNV